MTPREEIEKTLRIYCREDPNHDWSSTTGYTFGRYLHFREYHDLGVVPATDIPTILKNLLLGKEDTLNAAWLTWKLESGKDGKHSEDGG